jgi:transglutaminase-like putative cysteine protease
MTTYRIVHRTDYRYAAPMSDGFTMAHLRPRSTAVQSVLSHTLDIDPPPDEFDEFDDVFGNHVVRFAVHRPHRSLTVTATSVVRRDPAPVFPDGPPWEQVAEAAAGLRGEEAATVGALLAGTPLTAAIPELHELTDDVFTPQRPIVAALSHLCDAVFRRFRFEPGFTDVTTPIADVVHNRRGVCQDFAHVTVACLRSRGIPARYVSGYIETQPPPGQARLVGADASHAWCSAWVPEFGWLDFDPTNNQFPPTHHVTVGWGREYGDVAPVRGVVIGPDAGQQLSVSVDVERLPATAAEG